MGPPNDISYCYAFWYFPARSKTGASLFVIELSLDGIAGGLCCISAAADAHVLVAVAEGGAASGPSVGDLVEGIASR